MNQVDRRQQEQLLSEELALLKTCGGEIRKSDYRARERARAITGRLVPVGRQSVETRSTSAI